MALVGHIDLQVSELDSIQSALGRAAARRRWLRGWNGLWRGLFAGAVVWLLALAAFKLAPIPSSILPGAVGAGRLADFGRVPPRLVPANRPCNKPPAGWTTTNVCRNASAPPWNWASPAPTKTGALLLMADAARFASKLDPRKLIPFHLPRATRWALAALALSAGLGFLPEYRTQAFLQKQQDAQAVKEAGKILLDLTRRTLERHDPLLPPIERSLQSVQELGLKMDKVSLSRSDALKDLANVSEKIKAQQKDLGEQIPALKSLEKSARDASRTPAAAAAQKEMEALQKSLGKSADSPEALEKLAADLQAAQKALAGMPNGDSPGASAARQQMAQSLSDLAKQARDMGQPLPDLESAIAALQSSKMDSFHKDMDAATTDLNKLKETAQALQKLQQQADRQGKDLPEQLKFGQADAAQGTLQKDD